MTRAWKLPEGSPPVTAAEVRKYLDAILLSDPCEFPPELLAEVVAWASEQLGQDQNPDEVLIEVLERVRQIHFDQARTCGDCGTVLVERGWRGKQTITCLSCGSAWEVRATDRSASVRRVGANGRHGEDQHVGMEQANAAPRRPGSA